MPLFFLAALRVSLLFYKFHVSIHRVPEDSVFFPPTTVILGRGGFSLLPPHDKKTPSILANQGLIGIRQRLILPGRVQPSTFSTGELNFCVRDGNRWNLSVIATGNGSYLIASPFSSCFHFTYLRLKEKGRRPLHPDNCTSNDSLDRSN